ncbi:MAG: AI-2E family transporter [Alphaproteobacteria bacterium]|jgi:predicted PurR-regulated permease PerM|nr:AI-2E family transporter [Alphaproteobacteria bacterium]MBU1560018.1 AI-2E family transporter [Alphaproteobacteria bacterium]MBU2302320.1 AI-2E family transporter [Alphaproteobacteria bacterium]MBU2369406.1 AI-2E family transporter [Alphaproteobacteria bacterium]
MTRAATKRATHTDSDTSQFERIAANAARMALVFIGFIVLLVALQAGQVILAPVTLAIVIGLMFGPVADRVERFGVPPALSAAVVVLMFIGVIATGVALFAVPLSDWVARAPLIWAKLQQQLANLEGSLQSVSAFQEQLTSVFGSDNAMTVTVEDGGQMIDVAMLAPAILAQVLIFLASLYFFVATRDHIRISVLSLCVSRRMRWRTAHVFRDVEAKVSRFLLSITFINFCVGCAVSLVMWAIGMPSPILWGAMAAVLNYIPYVGQGVMVLVLLAVGLGTQTELQAILLPVGCYVAINFVEGQIVTPHFIGRTMTLNPFIIFLSITFWLWAWGPVGGLVAVPSLLIATSIMAHALPSKPMVPSRPVRRTRNMTPEQELLANTAKAIREQAELEDSPAEKRQEERMQPPEGTAPSGMEPSR